jgi:hypothetical protein
MTGDINEREWLKPTDEAFSKDRLKRLNAVVLDSDRGGIEIRVRRAQNDILGYYCRNGHITALQLRAGNRFRVLHHFGYELRERYVLMRYGAITGDVDDETLIDMVDQYRKARAAISGVKEKQIALDVCCFGVAAGRHGQMDRLRSALDDLIRHFGYKEADDNA